MEEHVARLLAAVGILIWGLLAIVSLILEWRQPRTGTAVPGEPSVQPSGQPSKRSSQAV
jgi:hypothetical protein